jgi:hypothetical protein
MKMVKAFGSCEGGTGRLFNVKLFSLLIKTMKWSLNSSKLFSMNGWGRDERVLQEDSVDESVEFQGY